MIISWPCRTSPNTCLWYCEARSRPQLECALTRCLFISGESKESARPWFVKVSQRIAKHVASPCFPLFRSGAAAIHTPLPSTSTQAKTIRPPQNCDRVPANVKIEAEGVARLRSTANTCSARCSSRNRLINFSGCRNPQMTTYIEF